MFMSAFLSSSGKCQNVETPSSFFRCLTISVSTCKNDTQWSVLTNSYGCAQYLFQDVIVPMANTVPAWPCLRCW